MNQNVKKLLSFLGICGWTLGSIGGLGYSLYIHQYAVAGAIVVVAAMAFPTLKKFVKNLID